MTREKERKRRLQRARTEEFEIEPMEKEPNELPARFEVASRSGKEYLVSLRHLTEPLNHCTCPDFATNSLGTCKHVEAVRLHLEKDRPGLHDEAARQAEHPFGDNLVYLDATVSPPAVRFHLADEKVELIELREKVFGKRNALTKKKMAGPFADLEANAEQYGVAIAPEALRFVHDTLETQRLRQQSAREAKVFADEWDERQDAPPPFIMEGARFLIAKRRALLLDDTGLDKSRQAIMAASHMLHRKIVRKAAIICPEAQTKRWLRLIRETTDFRAHRLEAVGSEEGQEASSREESFYVVSYNQSPALEKTLKSEEIGLLILDHVHRMKSWQGAAGRLMKSLTASHVYELASPALLDQPQVLFYAVQLLDPYLLGPSWGFFDRHLIRDSRGAILGAKEMDEAVESVEPVSLRRRRDEVRDQLTLPLELRYVVNPTSAQKKRMAPVTANLIKKIEGRPDWGPVDRAEIVAQIARLRKLCDYLEPGVGRQASPKVKELFFLLEDLGKEDGEGRFVLFTRFRDIAAKLTAVFEEAGLTAPHLSRAVSPESRAQAIEALQSESIDGLVVADEVLHELPALDQRIAVHLDAPWTPATLRQRERVAGKSSETPPELEAYFVLAESVEDLALEALDKHHDRLDDLVPDSAVELEALPAQGSEALGGVIDLVIDIDRLKKQIPKGLPARKAAPSPKARKPKGRRPRKPAPKGRQRTGKKGGRPGVAARGDVVAIGLSPRSAPSMGSGPEGLRRLGLAVAVTYSFRKDSFTAWRHEYVNDLIRTVRSASLVVGWRPSAFDYQILSTYTGIKLSRIPTIDILAEVQKSAGVRIPPELLVEATLEKRRRLMIEQAVRLWRQGRIRELAEQVYEDVRLARDLFLTAFNSGKVFYRKAPTGELASVSTPLKSIVPEKLAPLLKPRRRA